MYNTSHLLQLCMCGFMLNISISLYEREAMSQTFPSWNYVRRPILFTNYIFNNCCQLHYIISCQEAYWFYLIHPWSDTSCKTKPYTYMTLMQIYYLDIKDDFFFAKRITSLMILCTPTICRKCVSYLHPQDKKSPNLFKILGIQKCERSFTSAKVQKQFMGLHWGKR